MTVPELIKRYRIAIHDQSTLRIFEPELCKRDNALEEIRAKKLEIIAYITEQEREAERKAAERRKKIDAIPGLKEIKDAIDDLDAWNYEFEASFDDRRGAGVGGLGVRPRPTVDIPALKEKYPAAAAYLRAENEAYKTNDELSSIGYRALDAIIEDHTRYAEAMEKMEAEISAFTDRHIWD